MDAASEPGLGLVQGVAKGGRSRGSDPLSKATTTTTTTAVAGVRASKMSYNHVDKDGMGVFHADDQLGLGLRVIADSGVGGGIGTGGIGSGGGDRRYAEADWSRGLQLSIPSMLLHSSDTQVNPYHTSLPSQHALTMAYS